MLRELTYQFWRHIVARVLILRLVLSQADFCCCTICHCSAYTELTDGNNCSQQYLCCFWTRIVKNRFFSLPLLFQEPRVVGLKTGTPGVHSLQTFSSSLLQCCSISHQVWKRGSRTIFSSTPALWKVHRPAGNRLAQTDMFAEFVFAHAFLAHLVTVNVVVHRHKDDPILDVEWMHFVVVHHLLGFVEELICCVSWVNHPLEHEWLSGNVIEISIRQFGCG